MAARRPLRRVRRTAASPPETRTSRYRDDSAISGIGRDYERLAGINFPRGFLVYLFCQLDGVVGGFMCKKTTPLDGHLTHHDSCLHDCIDGLIAPKSLPIFKSIILLVGQCISLSCMRKWAEIETPTAYFS